MSNIIKKILPNKFKKWLKNKLGMSSSQTLIYRDILAPADRHQGINILVTGATGAIGTAICKCLVKEGAVVGVCGRSMEKVITVICELQTVTGVDEGRLIPIIIDVTDEKSIETGIKDFVSKVGGIDVLINNAGGGARGQSKPIFEQSIEVIDQIINANLRGTILCSRIAAQEMVKQKHGKIINMSSVVGIQGKAIMADYAASKAAVLGFTKSIAIELGQYGITVNAISPGMVNQAIFDDLLPVKATNSNVLKRFGYTSEVANLVSFIIGSEADYITGHNFVIDGGRSLGLMGDN